MTVTYVSGSSAANSSAGSTILVATLPTGIVAGNLLVAVVYAKSTASSPDFTAPSGWTLAGKIIGQAQGGMAVWTKLATSAESAPTFAGPDRLAVDLLQYSGATATDGPPQFATGTGTATTAPSVNAPSAADQLLLAFGSFGGSTWTTPSGTTFRVAARSVGNQSVYTYDTALTAAGATPTYSSTQSSSTGWIAAAVLLGNPNSPPAADAGPDQNVAAGAPVSLTGTDSDPEGNIVSRDWTQTGGPAVTLSGSGATRTFTAPSLSTSSTLAFSYTVTDAGGLTASDTMTVTVAKATVDRLRLGTDTVTLRLGDQPVSKIYLGDTLVWP